MFDYFYKLREITESDCVAIPLFTACLIRILFSLRHPFLVRQQRNDSQVFLTGIPEYCKVSDFRRRLSFPGLIQYKLLIITFKQYDYLVILLLHGYSCASGRNGYFS